MEDVSHKRRTLSIRACTFCKKRHLRCDGVHPCSQCLKRNEECVFEETKRQRKKQNPKSSSASEVVKCPVFRFHQIPFQHFAFIASFAQSVQPLFPYFIPRTYQAVQQPFSLQISNQKIFTIVEDLITTSNAIYTPEEICDALEYSIVCSHGSRLVCKDKKLSVEFWKKADSILDILITHTPTNPDLADRALSLICLLALVNIINGTIEECIPILLKGYSIYLQHSDSVQTVISNRLFASLSATSPNLEDCWYWINKLKLPEMTYVNAINYLFTTTYILLWMILCSELKNLSFKPKILQKLLEGIEQVSTLETTSQEGILCRTISEAICVIIKREKGIQMGEKELVAAMRVILKSRRDNLLGVGLVVSLMLGVWSLQIFTCEETKEVVEECWKLFEEVEANFGLVTLFRVRMKNVEEAPIQITFEVLETLAKLENSDA